MASKLETKIIDDPIIKIGNTVLSHVGNSVKMTTGRGKRSVGISTKGGGQLELVTSSDVNDRKSVIEFEMFATAANIKILEKFGKEAEDGDLTTIELVDAGKSYAFPQMILAEGDSYDLQKDGKSSVKFEGLPLSA